MTHLNENDLLLRAAGLGDGMSRSRLAAHCKFECLLLDNRCCGLIWGLLRQSEGQLVTDVELVYGKDFWLGIPQPLRTVFGVMALYGPASTDELAFSAARGFAAAEKALALTKAELIARGREAAPKRGS